MQIDWLNDYAAGCWHAAMAVAHGIPLLDRELEAAIRSATPATQPEQIGPLNHPTAALLDACRLRLAPRGEAAYLDELSLRAGPLREQWDARGRGILRCIDALTEPVPVHNTATAQMVAPSTGGHGIAVPNERTLTFEAVLANPVPQLPEVLRLAWLLAQVRSASSNHCLNIALIPAVLAAGNEVELCEDSPEMLQLALQSWHVPATLSPDQLLHWWLAYRDTPTPWAIALEELACL